MHNSAQNWTACTWNRLAHGLLCCSLLTLCGFAPNDDPGSSATTFPPPAVAACSLLGTAHRTDHVAYETGECWDVWHRAADACTKTSIHTFVLDDPFRSFVVYAADDVDAANATNLATNASACAQRKLTLEVERELASAPGVWATIANYTVNGTWLSSYEKCSLWTNYKFVPISTQTSRVRLTVQAIRQDGSYAGTQTFGGYSVPVGYQPCGLNP